MNSPCHTYVYSVNVLGVVISICVGGEEYLRLHCWGLQLIQTIWESLSYIILGVIETVPTHVRVEVLTAICRILLLIYEYICNRLHGITS
jgi:hypothetical protein